MPWVGDLAAQAQIVCRAYGTFLFYEPFKNMFYFLSIVYVCIEEINDRGSGYFYGHLHTTRIIPFGDFIKRIKLMRLSVKKFPIAL